MNTETVRLRALSLVPEGDEVLVGDPESGTFVAIPAVGGVVIAALQEGASLTEAGRRAEEFVGEPVDVVAFVEVLRELGFLDEGEARATPVPTGPVQTRSWVRGVSQEFARPLFGRVAWAIYGAAVFFDLTVLLLVPALRPDPATHAFAFPDIGLSALLLLPLSFALACVHEAWHWLAARSLDLPARFGIDRRMAFLVAETDLSQLWTVARRRRYGPLLAGLAIDASMLAVALLLRLLMTGPGVLDSLLATVAFILTFRMVWQAMVFLRTDLYAVMITYLGCRDLWRVKGLLLRRAFGRLSAAQAAELSAADPRDVRAGLWFRWLWLIGLGLVTVWLVLIAVPMLDRLLRWTVAELAAGPGSWRFWYGLACSCVMLAPWLISGALAVRERLSAGR
ncbi:hypothetical protein ACIBH1_03620 [Nonomuraea sp. NPDC050663]|uniref:hypothetical protein n=1 Tax=Nonomuraea sp. NPDC050663 TaxID=3364370 RepID=UPI00378A8CD3